MGAWIETESVLQVFGQVLVAPYVGAWIETMLLNVCRHISTSHPTWVRGLKPKSAVGKCCSLVAPYVGAWIETWNLAQWNRENEVAPYVGAWIETL